MYLLGPKGLQLRGGRGMKQFLLTLVVATLFAKICFFIVEIGSDHYTYILAFMLLAWEHLSDIPCPIVFVLCFLFWNGRLKKRFNDISGDLLRISHAVSDVKIMQRVQMNLEKEKQQGD